MRRLLVTLMVLGTILLASAASAPAQTATTTTTIAMTDDGQVGQTKSVIPKPNSGSAPKQAGDRGGALQQAVFGLLVVALAVIGTVIVRSTIRNSRIRDAELQKGSGPRNP
jgi:hypothetical protein